MKYYAEIQQLADAHNELVALIENVTDKKAEEKLFDEWSLKEVIIHITAWNECLTANLDAVIQGKEPQFYGTVQEFNKKAVEKAGSASWPDVLHRFIVSGKTLDTAYRFFPDDLFEHKFWKDKSSTPLKFLSIVTKHYVHEHMPIIKEKLL